MKRDALVSKRFPELPPADGIYFDVPPPEYHAWAAVSSSLVKPKPTPAHFRHFLDTLSRVTKSTEIGSAFHTRILEPGRFDLDVAIKPEGLHLGKGARARQAQFREESEGKTILSEDEARLVDRMVERALRNPIFRGIVERPGANEVSCVWTDPPTGLVCKCRVDRYVEGVCLVDIKTTDQIDPDGFSRAMRKFGYATQCAHQRAGFEAVSGASLRYCIAAQENGGPLLTAVYYLDEYSLGSGFDVRSESLATIAAGVDSGIWPGVAGAEESMVCLSVDA